MGAKFGKDESHAVYAPWEYLHTSVGSFDGGKCVGAHEYYYKEGDSCSYRWQAHYRATGPDSGLYGAWQNALGFRQSVPSEADRLWLNKALNARPTHKPGNKSTVAGLPFRTAFSPWKNNAHHLLPDAELRDGIFGVASDVAEAQDLIIKGLLDKNYDLNHWKNMIILPQEQEIGCKLRLPTHPQGDRHREYSATLKREVGVVLKVYKPIVKKMKDGTFKTNHEVPEPQDIVAGLMAISDSVYGAIVALQPVIATRCQASDSISINSLASQISTKLGV